MGDSQQIASCSSAIRLFGAPPSLAGIHDTAKALKKEHQQAKKQPSLAISDDLEASEASDDSNSSVTKVEKSEAEDAGENDSANSPAPQQIKKRRKKRRIRLTNHVQRNKRKADRREKILTLKTDADDHQEGEENVDTQNGEPPLKDEPPEKKAPPPISTYTPFQLLCDNIIRKLISKDPDEFFLNPVNPEEAPDYSDIIKQPMDFSTIKTKIEAGVYNDLSELIVDAKLIAENAILYNEPDTIFYAAAQKLLYVVNYYFSEKYLTYLYYSLPFAKEIDEKQLGISIRNTLLAYEASSKQTNKSSLNILDEIDTGELLRMSANSTKLTERIPECHLAYLDNKDGAIALNILTGPREKSVITLGDLLKPLDKGNPGLCLPLEPRICNDYLTTYTDPGPFASFAPQFDSTWSTLSKRDTDLLLSCYGDRSNVSDVFSMRQFVADAGDEMITAVDAMLDSLTDGEHSRVLRQLEGKDAEESTPCESMEVTSNEVPNKPAKKTARRPEKQKSTKSPKEQRLIQTGSLITELKNAQYARLSAPPSITLTANILQPDELETQLAEKITSELTHQVLELGAKPAHLVATGPIHQALGLNDDDYDVLREFMVV